MCPNCVKPHFEGHSEINGVLKTFFRFSNLEWRPKTCGLENTILAANALVFEV